MAIAVTIGGKDYEVPDLNLRLVKRTFKLLGEMEALGPEGVDWQGLAGAPDQLEAKLREGGGFKISDFHKLLEQVSELVVEAINRGPKKVTVDELDEHLGMYEVFGLLTQIMTGSGLERRADGGDPLAGAVH